MRRWLAIVVLASGLGSGCERDTTPRFEGEPVVIRLDLPEVSDRNGGIIAADLTGDGRMDFLVTVTGHVAAYANDGSKLWVLETDVRVSTKSEDHGLPGHHGPGVQAGDIDGDGRTEVVFLTQDSVLHVVDGSTGQTKWTAQPPVPDGAERWEMAIVANLRGEGDRDVILQTTDREQRPLPGTDRLRTYALGRFLTAYRFADLAEGRDQPLWSRDDYFGCAHNGARIADLDGDGRDEVLGGTILSPEGDVLYTLPMPALRLLPHLDSIFVADVLPDRPGLEVVALEERGGERVFLYDEDGLIWAHHYLRQEPQNAVIGRFVPDVEASQIWCRSRYNTRQKPFVFDAAGNVIATYEMAEAAPPGWTLAGVEVIHTIDWTGEPTQLAAAKERHTAGDVGVFDPITGKFLLRIPEQADRLYVADVFGDWREEVIVLAGNELRIYQNPAPNPRPDQPRLWDQPHYRRSKTTWNYYSP